MVTTARKAKKSKEPRLQTASKRTPQPKVSTNTTEKASKWIRINRPFPLSDEVKNALQRLYRAGHVAYLVGGSVRDFFLGRISKDHDIATSAGPDELCRLFPRAVTVGKAFGVLKVPIFSISDQKNLEEGGANKFLEIATFREDLLYKDHRHPDGVKFSGPAEDARRRDFTVNGLFFDPKTSRVLDAVGGFDDLKSKIIRAIGNPQDRFQEDALRLLRAVRFTAVLDFTMDGATEKAVRDHAALIKFVSAERIRDELTLMLKSKKSPFALDCLDRLGLLELILPELTALKKVIPSAQSEENSWEHTLKVMDRLTSHTSFVSSTSGSPFSSPFSSSGGSSSGLSWLVWGTLLHDVGKPISWEKNNHKSFTGQETEGSQIARMIGERLKFSTDEIDRILTLIAEQFKFKEVFNMREATLQRFIRQPFFEELLAFHKAEVGATDGNLVFYEFCSSKRAELQEHEKTAAPKLLDGNDLIQLGLKPGPGFSNILRTIEDLALEKTITTKEAALEYVMKYFVN